MTSAQARYRYPPALALPPYLAVPPDPHDRAAWFRWADRCKQWWRAQPLEPYGPPLAKVSDQRRADERRAERLSGWWWALLIEERLRRVEGHRLARGA